jgi:ankyrin repeat protein
MQWFMASFVILGLSIPSLAAQANLDLVDAARKRDASAIRSLLSQKADVNKPQADGATALQWAAHWNDLATAELLIAAGANVNAANDYGATPLTVACTNANGPLVEVLLKAGADPNTTLPSGETALMSCARTNSVQAVKSLLDRGANVEAKESRQGQTALMWAAAQNQPEVVQALIEGGADIHTRSKGGFTPLLFAARTGAIDSARILLAAGADVNEAMAAKGTPGGPLLMAAASGHEALAVLLLENGADPNVSDGGAAPLHYAVMNGMTYLRFRPNMPGLAKALLAHGANPNARFVRSSVSGLGGGASGATPFILAAAAVDSALMRLLVDAGADPLLPSTTNVTALMAAAGLLQAEAFTEAQQKEALEAVKLAIQLGGDVNAANKTGRTALHGATRMVSNPIIQFLVDNGAKLDARDVYQQTPLSIASGVHLPWVPKGEELAEEGALRESTANLLLKLGATPLTAPGYFTPVEQDSDVYRLNPKQVTVPGVSETNQR